MTRQNFSMPNTFNDKARIVVIQALSLKASSKAIRLFGLEHPHHFALAGATHLKQVYAR